MTVKRHESSEDDFFKTDWYLNFEQQENPDFQQNDDAYVSMGSFFEADTWYQDDECSITFIVREGPSDRVINHGSSTYYEVISGKGMVEKDGTRRVLIPGDFFYVPAGTEYRSIGFDTLVMLATSTPPFDASAVEVIESKF